MTGPRGHTEQRVHPEADLRGSRLSAMSTDTHRQIANDIWSICGLLRGPCKRHEYRKVILPLTVLRSAPMQRAADPDRP